MGNKPNKPVEVEPSEPESVVDPDDTVITAASTLGSFLFPYLITSIDVVVTGPVENDKYGEGAEYIEFDGKILADPNDTDVAYLIRVEEKNVEDDGRVVFKAIKVSQETFTDRLAEEDMKVLCCIHGFQADPEAWMGDCKEIQENDSFDHLVVPAIWPSVGKAGGLIDLTRKYDEEQEIAFQAGKAMKSITDVALKVNMSLMVHSMGNRVMFSFAKTSDVKNRFDAIFMVAADVWEEVFNERVIENSWWQPVWNWSNLWKDTGIKVCDMVKEDGKIYVICFPSDRALLASEYAENGLRRRLGRFGKAGQKGRIHKHCVDKLVEVDFSEHEEAVKKADRATLHSYHAMPKAVEYYASVMDA